MSLKIVELCGAPGSGKTYLANQLQASFTRAGINSFYVHEFIKDHAVRKLPITPFDQLWVAGNQHRIESACYGVPPKYSVVLTDSPVSLAGFYAYQYGGKKKQWLELTTLIKSWQRISDLEFNNERSRYRVSLQRKHFKPEGRFENTFEEAEAVDNTLTEWLNWAYDGDIEKVPQDDQSWIQSLTSQLRVSIKGA